MKCVECVDYAECSKKHNLTIKRKHCPMAKVEYVQTNADRIRAMSDEELAKFCNSGFHCLICSEGDKGKKGVCDVKCDEHCLEWLKQPVKENDNG